MNRTFTLNDLSGRELQRTEVNAEMGKAQTQFDVLHFLQAFILFPSPTESSAK